MRVLVIFAHPVETSYQTALHQVTVESLKNAGHEVDDCDLYAEGFDPVLCRDERLAYHDPVQNRIPVASYVDRVLAADALILVYPVWNFGFPAIMKGFFDRVFLPGVSFTINDGAVRPCLHTIRKMSAITTYGATPFRAFLAGDPPKRIVKRALRAVIKPGAPVHYLAHYDMNNSTPDTRSRFLGRVQSHLAGF